MKSLARGVVASACLALASLSQAATPSPIPVTLTSNATPFAKTLVLTFSEGSGTASGTLVVPAGKRLVVQQLSLYTIGLPVGGSMHGYVGAYSSGDFNFFYFAPAVADGSAYPGSATPLTFSADAGSTMEVNGYRSQTAGSAQGYVVISGNLVPQ